MEFKNVIFNAARDGKLRRLKVFLDNRPRDEVTRLVTAKTNGATPLVLSCRNGHKDVVAYLVDNCQASVEQSGSVTFDGETIEGAPPLWCAAAAGHLDIVKLLVKSGANVNSTTKTNSTPLRAACFDGHFEIVKYLIEHNADIEIANRHGHTCLMIACYKGHYRIAKYLIDIGADVNRKSVKGNTALHDCAESGSLEIMKLLILSGARIDVDAYGMTPLLAAAVTGHLHIVEFLIGQKDLVGKQERIDALELLGATFVDKKRDMMGAITLWKRAMLERYVDGYLAIPKALVSSPISAYENTTEVESLEELDELISDPDSMRMQALLVRERILGPAHPDTSYYIRYRGAVYADMGHFERCITLWMYALDMQQKILEPLSPMTQSSLLSFAELFSFMMSEGGRTRGGVGAPAANNNNHQNNNNSSNNNNNNHQNNNNNQNNNIRGHINFGNWPDLARNENNQQNGSSARSGNSSNNNQGHQNNNNNNNNNNGGMDSRYSLVNYCDIMTVFQRAVKEVRMGQKALESGESTLCGGDSTYLNRTIVILLHLVCLFTKLIPHLSGDQVFEVKQAVHDFVQLKAKGKGGSTPLHLACSKESSTVGRYPICVFPSVAAISLLIQCGADPNAIDNEGNTPLHHTAFSKPVKEEVVQALLGGGAHFDTVNSDKRTFYNYLSQPVHEFGNAAVHTSLKCLAARAVRRYRLDTSELPRTLLEVVANH